MAAFVTQRERTRRIVLIIVSSIFCAGFVGWGAYLLSLCTDKEEGVKVETEEGEEKPPDKNVEKSIKQLEKELREFEDNFERLEASIVNFIEFVGWRLRSSDTADRYSHTVRWYTEVVQKEMDHWIETLQRGWQTRTETINVTKFDKWGDQKETAVRLHITDLFAELKKISESLDVIRKKEEEIKAKAVAEEKAAVDRLLQVEAENRKRIEGDKPDQLGGILGAIVKELQNLVEGQKRAHQQVGEKEEVLLVKQDELALLKDRNILEFKKRDAEIDVYRIRAVEVKKANELEYEVKLLAEENEKMDPDARVIMADNENGIVYVDFTHKHRVFPGMQFRVFEVGKGGIKKDKGMVKLLKIGEERSKAIVVGSAQPIKSGDYLYEPRFIDSRVNTFAFAGKLVGRLSKDEVVSRIEAKGDRLHPKARVSTHFLVCGEGYENDPEYKLLDEYPIQTIRERDLYVYLGIEW
ncbi:MAG: hypothetical protein A2Z34_11485 [Planctomycetes bacterium RBG_16_59_8]|nr:MAG: hypothetical protein A2Z34_11485 [Planctomycetes bacterium RBG_16_59_8]